MAASRGETAPDPCYNNRIMPPNRPTAADQETDAALDELTRLSQLYGLYDNPPVPRQGTATPADEPQR